MTRILVSGLINIETTLRVDSFPLTYEPVRYPFFGINSTDDPYEAIQKAIVFASYKIGEAGAAEGFLSARELERLVVSF